MRSGRDQLTKKLRQCGIVPHHQHVFIGAALPDQTLKLGIGCLRFECLGMQDTGLIAGFRADQLGRLQAALQRAGDDEIEAELQPVKDVGEVQAVAFAVFIQWSLNINLWIIPPGARAGMAQDVKVQPAAVGTSGKDFLPARSGLGMSGTAVGNGERGNR